IDVVYQGCDPIFAKEISDEVKQDVSKRHNLPERFLLYVGSIEERKNLLLVVKAVAMLHKKGEDINLVAVGRRTPYLNEIVDYAKSNGISHLLHIRHGVNYNDLPVFYTLATAFVYPSRIEGFGIPLLEAITSGLPAIGCTGSCLEEAGGPSSLYVNPDDVDEMADAIHSVFIDLSLRNNMIAKGKEYARMFDIAKLTKDLFDVYMKVTTI
ncbi:MAG: glycosyltransferase family 4 protein, partial [Prevotella sp.]